MQLLRFPPRQESKEKNRMKIFKEMIFVRQQFSPWFNATVFPTKTTIKRKTQNEDSKKWYLSDSSFLPDSTPSSGDVAESVVSSLRLPKRNAERCRSFSALWNTKHKTLKTFAHFLCVSSYWYLTQRPNLLIVSNWLKENAREQEKENIKQTKISLSINHLVCDCLINY